MDIWNENGMPLVGKRYGSIATSRSRAKPLEYFQRNDSKRFYDTFGIRTDINRIPLVADCVFVYGIVCILMLNYESAAPETSKPEQGLDAQTKTMPFCSDVLEGRLRNVPALCCAVLKQLLHSQISCIPRLVALDVVVSDIRCTAHAASGVSCCECAAELGILPGNANQVQALQRLLLSGGAVDELLGYIDPNGRHRQCLGKLLCANI